MLIGVGIDTADVRRIQQLYEARGDAFTRRWFTEAELDQCRRAAVPARALATRFAAKEAVWKAIGLPAWGGPVPWRWIAIVDGGGADGPEVVLTGPVGRAADAASVGVIRVAMSARDGIAMAVATAERARG